MGGMDIVAEITEPLLYKSAEVIEEWMKKMGVRADNAPSFSLSITQQNFPDTYISLHKGDEFIGTLHIHYDILVVGE